MNEPLRLAIADGHRLVADAIGRLLDSRFGPVDIVVDGRALIELAENRRPALVLIDLRLPGVGVGVGGLDIVRHLRRRLPEARIVALCHRADPTEAKAAYDSGARGVVVKTATADDLLRAVDDVLAGRLYVPPALAGHLVASMLSPAETPRDAVTPRENQIAELVAEGLETAEIATRLCIAEVTVRTHLRRVLGKLGLRNRIELARHVLVAELDNPSLASSPR